MESATSISEILSGKKVNEDVTIRGWLHNKRSSGGIHFFIVRDGTGVIQCTIKKDRVAEDVFDAAKKITQESTMEIRGVVKEDQRAPGGYEIQACDMKILHLAEEGFPVAKKYHGPDFLLDHRHLWIRSQKMQRILRVRAGMLRAAREWLDQNGFTEFHAPTLISAACEGGATLFTVKYFDGEAYLTQSWQLYAEAAIASLGKIYTIAPSFRAEKSKTRRHLTEFWHLEVEVPWCDLEGIMKIEEDLLTYILHSLAERSARDLEALGRQPGDLLKINPPFPRITYDEAVEMLNRDGVKFEWGNDLGWIEEKRLTLKFDKPFFVTHYPRSAKAFYHKPDPRRPEVTLSADLLAPEGYGEITGGGQRIENINDLLDRIRENNLNPEDYKWYIDLRRYGSVPHAGFGLGVERTVAWVCKLNHIRDAIAFPRLINRIYP
ncbi:asparagine--tRNA ligase [Candidatus Bathyarchaeota archaeon]|nr:asparagine--tRNA ligase [Candidatus Bathyarchaeota archaeon]